VGIFVFFFSGTVEQAHGWSHRLHAFRSLFTANVEPFDTWQVRIYIPVTDLCTRRGREWLIDPQQACHSTRSTRSRML
jgi:hypothetical protein